MTKQNISILLVVDDSNANRLLLSFLLGELGFQVDESENGEKAVEQALEFEYSAIFMDINMPVMDGIEATSILRSLNYQKPIFVCSADNSYRQKSKLKHLGFTDFIAKPIEVSDIQKLLERHSIQKSLNRPFDDRVFQQKLTELSHRFTANIPTLIKNIEQSIQNGSLGDLKQIAHKLKGTAGQLGFPQIAQMAKKIECALKERQLSDALELYHQLILELIKLNSE